MLKLIIIFYIVFSFLLICLILINKGKGAEMGGITSSENDLFGSKGSNNILNKIIIFTALVLLMLNILINITNNNIKKNDVQPSINIKEYTIATNEIEKK